jgi:hypothetical protein
MVSEETKQKLRRPMGAVLVLLSLVEAKFFIYDVLESFKNAHEATISYSEKGIFLPFITLLLGLILLFVSDQQLKRVKTPEKKLTKTGWLLVIVTVAFGFGANEWFKGKVKEYGYDSADALQLRQLDTKQTTETAPEK